MCNKGSDKLPTYLTWELSDLKGFDQSLSAPPHM